jgi:hypothetical protein
MTDEAALTAAMTALFSEQRCAIRQSSDLGTAGSA